MGRARGDPFGKKQGIHTQMEILEQGLWDLQRAESLVSGYRKGGEESAGYKEMSGEAVGKLADCLGDVRKGLQKRLTTLGIAETAPTVQCGWRAAEHWNEREEGEGGVGDAIRW